MPDYKKVAIGFNKRYGYELVEWDDGHQEYHCNGNAHREDGPAIIEWNGKKTWWLDDNKLKKKWFLENPKKIAEMQAWDLFEPEELVRLKLDKL